MSNSQEFSPAPQTGPALSAALRDARDHTLSIYAHLADGQHQFPQLAVVNPPWWELGHLGWFQEFWCQRYAPDAGGAVTPSILQNADQLFDSSAVPHAQRWSLELPPDAIRAYLAATLAKTLERCGQEQDTLRYFHELALYHEDMHGEAMLMSLQTLGLPPPAIMPRDTLHAPMARVALNVDLAFPGGTFLQGSGHDAQATRFVWDNEKSAHEVMVAPFALAQRLVTNGEFAQFVADGGYARRELWSDAGWSSRNRRGLAYPAYWRAGGSNWQIRHFDTWQDAAPDAPVVHVTAHEAEAYCGWAGRRLPTESEAEFAAVTGPASLSGKLWEWTASAFAPYPGFAAGPYADYSAPWFGSHRVVRGGSFASRARLLHPRFRNFYLPERHDSFVGFRTCAQHG